MAIVNREDNGVSVTITNQTNQVISNPANLKNEFTRGDAYQEGFGLGLWIADQLVLKNEGSVQLSMMEDRFVAILQLPEAVVGGLPR